MPEIVLATLNARYIHASFGLRCLRANLGEWRERSALLEFTIDERPMEVAERILALEPRLVGLGVYIWNVTPMTELVALLKRIRPELIVVLGGPEVSHETDRQEIIRLADATITGEGDLAFADYCRQALAPDRLPEPSGRVIVAPLPDLAQVALPDAEYSDEDIAHRLIYVEASRGCPFTCEFCLSSLDVPVRAFPLDDFLAAMDRLHARGVRHFKFVDRTFNLNLATSRRILEFFLARLEPGLFLHFEMVPDRMPEELRGLLTRFPAGTLQLEIGVQTFNAGAAAAIKRRQDYGKLEDNFRFLRAHTQAHLHADLIAGLPGETLDSFAAGFDRLVGLGPQEIQVGILKRLRGTPIARHDGPEQMVYASAPPYEILRNRVLDFATVQRLRRFARFWDLVGNSGNFVRTLPQFWSGGASPFGEFLRFADWMYARDRKHHGISLARLAELVFTFLTTERGRPASDVAGVLAQDWQRAGHGDLPPALRPHLSSETKSAAPSGGPGVQRTARRQGRHLGTAGAPDA